MSWGQYDLRLPPDWTLARAPSGHEDSAVRQDGIGQERIWSGLQASLMGRSGGDFIMDA